MMVNFEIFRRRFESLCDLQGLAIQSPVGFVLFEIRRYFDLVALRIDCYQLRIKECVAVPAKEEACIRVVLSDFGVTVQVCCFKYLGWLNSGECASLAKAVEHRKSECSLPPPSPNDCLRVTTHQELDGVWREVSA